MCSHDKDFLGQEKTFIKEKQKLEVGSGHGIKPNNIDNVIDSNDLNSRIKSN